jgi:hypothetical protein
VELRDIQPTSATPKANKVTSRASRKASTKANRKASRAALQTTASTTTHKMTNIAAPVPKAPPKAKPPKVSVEANNKDPSVSYELLRLLGWFSLGVGYSLAILTTSVNFRWFQATTTAGCAWFVENKDHLAPSASWFALLLLGIKLPWLLSKRPTSPPTKHPTYNAGTQGSSVQEQLLSTEDSSLR